jgi:LmbE family N-acetylglucosaminyl deacetylase
LHSSKSTLSRIAGALTLGWSDSPKGRQRIRSAVSYTVRTALRIRSRPFSPGAIGTALVVAPHPDDETLGCGGTVALLARSKVRLFLAFMTDGGAPHPFYAHYSPGMIAEIRKAEARSAAAILGLAPDRLSFLDAEDGTLAGLYGEGKAQVAARIAGLILETKPDAVLLPCRRDGSSEHEAAFLLVEDALSRAGLGPRLLEFPIWAWRNPLLLLKPMLTSRIIWRHAFPQMRDLKDSAIDTYASQVRPIAPETTPALPPDLVSEFRRPEEFLFEQ